MCSAPGKSSANIRGVPASLFSFSGSEGSGGSLTARKNTYQTDRAASSQGDPPSLRDPAYLGQGESANTGTCFGGRQEQRQTQPSRLLTSSSRTGLAGCGRRSAKAASRIKYRLSDFPGASNIGPASVRVSRSVWGSGWIARRLSSTQLVLRAAESGQLLRNADLKSMVTMCNLISGSARRGGVSACCKRRSNSRWGALCGAAMVVSHV